MKDFNNWWNKNISKEYEEEMKTLYNISKNNVFIFLKERNVLSKLNDNMTFRLYSKSNKCVFEWIENNKILFKKTLYCAR